MADGSDPKRRIIDHLKRVDDATAPDLAAAFQVTATAIRQQLDELAGAGLVRTTPPRPSGGRGRPPSRWMLTDLARDLFPDRHADLTVDLIDSIRDAMGEDGLDAVIQTRSNRIRLAYEQALRGTPVEIGVSRLAELRSAEGYLAEAIENDDGTLLLVEHHCPICDAASSCQALCRDELEIFQGLFTGQAVVTREQHLLSGDLRCVYRIAPTGPTMLP